MGHVSCHRALSFNKHCEHFPYFNRIGYVVVASLALPSSKYHIIVFNSVELVLKYVRCVRRECRCRRTNEMANEMGVAHFCSHSSQTLCDTLTFSICVRASTTDDVVYAADIPLSTVPHNIVVAAVRWINSQRYPASDDFVVRCLYSYEKRLTCNVAQAFDYHIFAISLQLSKAGEVKCLRWLFIGSV